MSKRIRVILVEPQSPGNIGMVARAMGNFGVSELRLVNPCTYLHPEARKFAVRAAPLLGKARVFPDLASALADLPMSVAATRRAGKLRGELLDVADAARLAAGLPAVEGVGLVFGREDAGLTSDEVSGLFQSSFYRTLPDTGDSRVSTEPKPCFIWAKVQAGC
ncbi:RNA methyltransferase [Syntrophotalea carbinolica]|uniref:RNA methyltransferase n=1 Tax=Syntrophotalea carbinolica TaxID=19 RepID=UPI000317A1F4|nr:RNA methyltransferase [Syntrophotalea carbinolica]